MVTRVRIEAQGASAAEVEGHINAVAKAIGQLMGELVEDTAGLVIQRDEKEPAGHTAFNGRGLVYLNVAHDAPQVAWLIEQTGACSTLESDSPPIPESPGQFMGRMLGFEDNARSSGVL